MTLIRSLRAFGMTTLVSTTGSRSVVFSIGNAGLSNYRGDQATLEFASLIVRTAHGPTPTARF